jgi:DNA-binding transcriptional MerR regulator
MDYTVKKLAKISGVSVRTLHYYDEIGLLQPSYIKPNGYRYYREKELLQLQQILFFRELGFELKKIAQILRKGDFDKMAALHAQKKVLHSEIERMGELIHTIDRTIGHLGGKKKMKEEEMYHGFNQEKQAEYERQVMEYFGEKAKTHIEESKENVKNWNKSDWQQSENEFEKICLDLAELMKKKEDVIRRHYQWLQQFWTPTKETYIQHGKFIVDSELREAYKKFHPQMPEFIAQAIREFAEDL